MTMEIHDVQAIHQNLNQDTLVEIGGREEGKRVIFLPQDMSIRILSDDVIEVADSSLDHSR